jgi:hypothetical protein
MSAKEAKKLAQEYIKEQARIMRKYGPAPKLSGERYQEAVHDTQRIIQTLSSAQNKQSK